MHHSRVFSCLLFVCILALAMASCGNAPNIDSTASSEKKNQNELSAIDTKDEKVLSYFFFDDSEYCVYKYCAPDKSQSLDIVYEYYDNGIQAEQTRLFTVDFSKRQNGRSGTISVRKSDHDKYTLMWASEDMKSHETCYGVSFEEVEDGTCIEYGRFPPRNIEIGTKYPVFLGICATGNTDSAFQTGQLPFDSLIAQAENVNALYLIFH